MVLRTFNKAAVALVCMALFVAAEYAHSQTQTPKLKIATLGAPSTSVWMVSVLVAKRFDLKNGIDIEWIEQPTTAAVYNDFAAGSYQVATGGVISYANQYARGVKSKVFATYQIFGTSVIVNNDRDAGINAPKDLNGKEIAAPLASVRVVIVAELVGASTRVGYRMVQQQSLLNMSGVLAWTLILVLMGLALQGLITKSEQHLLRWRPTAR